MTLDELELLTGDGATELAPYVNLLVARGYVRITGVRRAASGEAVPAFRLEERTGPEAPYVDRDGCFVDPNVPGPKPLGTNRSRRHKGTLQARVRIAAERLGQFLAKDVIAEVGISDQKELNSFRTYWHSLVKWGQFRRIGAMYEVSPVAVDPQVQEVRRYLKLHEGQTVSVEDLETALGYRPWGSWIRAALNLLEAEGYYVRRLLPTRPGEPRRFVIRGVASRSR